MFIKKGKRFLLSLLLTFVTTQNVIAQDYSFESYKNKTEEQINLLLVSNDLNSKIELAYLYKNIGKDDKAFYLCSEILKKDPENTKANLLLANLYKRNYQFKKALDILEKIKENSNEYKKALIEKMDISTYIKDEDYSNKILEISKNINDETISNLLKGIYYYSPLKLNAKEGEQYFIKVLEKDPNQVNALYFMGSISFEKNDRKKAKEYLNKAIQNDFSFSQAHGLLGFIEFIDLKIEDAIKSSKNSLSVNPLDIRAITSLGNGMTNKLYKDIELNNPNLQSNNDFFETSKKAINLLNTGNIRDSINLMEALEKKYPKNIHTYIHLGSFYINLSDYEKSIFYFKKALTISPEYGLAYCGLSNSLRFSIRNQEVKNKKLDLDVFDYSKIDMESFKKVFINFKDMPERYQKIMLYSIYPLKDYLGILAKNKATHYIIPFYEKSTDYKQGQYLKDQRTFDLRLWDDVRGRGGSDSATGMEDLMLSVYLDFNTLTHEFAHQVHMYAFETSYVDSIKKLYDNAKKKDIFLDYYAGSNEYEYFAQGLEAYIAFQGKSTLKPTAKNTRELLKTKDPDLYNFIEQIVTKDMKI